MTATTTAQMLKMSDADYFALDALNHSSLRWLIDDTPAHFRYRCDNPQHDPSPDMIFGTAVHSFVLGGPEVVRIDADSWRTKAAQEERDEALKRGHVPLLTKDYDRGIACRDAVLTHPIAGKLVATMEHAETVVTWDEEPGDGYKAQAAHYATNVTCKAKIDGISGRFVWDLKTTYNADAESFGRSAAKYGYASQAAHYIQAAKSIGVDNPEFLFLCVEKEPPHLVSVIKLDEYDVELGARRNARALDVYRQCVKSGVWPGYPETIQVAQLPRWAEIEMETA